MLAMADAPCSSSIAAGPTVQVGGSLLGVVAPLQVCEPIPTAAAMPMGAADRLLVWEVHAAPDSEPTDEPMKKKRNVNKEVGTAQNLARAARMRIHMYMLCRKRVHAAVPCSQLASKNWGGRRSRPNQYAKVDEQEKPPMTAEEALATAAAEGYVLEPTSTAGKCARLPAVHSCFHHLSSRWETRLTPSGALTPSARTPSPARSHRSRRVV